MTAAVAGLARASDVARSVDALFFSMLALTGAVALAVATLIVVFSIRYRQGSPADRSAAPTRGRRLEVAWTLVPFAIFVGLFIWAARIYANFYRPPPGAMEVYVVGKQWMWKLQHTNGRREVNELHLPLGEPVRIVLTTQDAIHSFFVPAFRIKQDAVPGRYTSITFTPTELGTFDLRCAEYCGTDHARMMGRIIVMQPDAFRRWLAAGVQGNTMAARGFELFREHGCSGCHNARSTVHAPDLAGVASRRVHLADGRTVIADDAYLRDSILLPKRDVVAGFEPVMPSFEGELSEEEILDLLAYLKSLRRQ